MDVFMYIIAPFATGNYLDIELLQQMEKKKMHYIKSILRI